MIGSILAPVLNDVMAFFEAMPEVAEKAAVLAINQVSEREGLSGLRTDMRKSIEFPTGYLEGDRLRVTKRARKGQLEAVITGRDRATSLARFAKGQTPGNTRGKGVTVKVKRGQTRHLKNAFMVNLRNGNVGVAVRVKSGDELRNSQAAVRLADNVYLLYGPSVEQVFRSVADRRSGAIGQAVSDQFIRQFQRLTSGKR